MRLDGWEVRLADAVEAARETPFAWGQHDCATWAFDVRRVLTGEDTAALWRGQFSTGAGWLRWMRRRGWADIEAGARALLGDPLPSVLLARRGDLVTGGARPAMGVCLGADAAFVGRAGLTFLPLAGCTLAWSV